MYKTELDKELARAMTVADLIRLLGTVDPNLHIGRIGHFGEFHAMDIFDVRVVDVHVADENVGWLSQPVCKALSVTTPDIGPDPD